MSHTHEPTTAESTATGERFEFQAEVSQVTYSVAIEGYYEADVCDLCELDTSDEHGVLKGPNETLIAVEGVDWVDYDGHFGNNVFFRVDGDTEAERNAAKERFIGVLHLLLLGVPELLEKAREADED